MILWLASFLPEQAVVVLALQQPPECRLLRDPPSFIKTAEKKIHIMRYLRIKGMTIIEADRVRAGAAICEVKEEVKGGKKQDQSRKGGRKIG